MPFEWSCYCHTKNSRDPFWLEGRTANQRAWQEGDRRGIQLFDASLAFLGRLKDKRVRTAKIKRIKERNCICRLTCGLPERAWIGGPNKPKVNVRFICTWQSNASSQPFLFIRHGKPLFCIEHTLSHADTNPVHTFSSIWSPPLHSRSLCSNSLVRGPIRGTWWQNEAFLGARLALQQKTGETAHCKSKSFVSEAKASWVRWQTSLCDFGFFPFTFFFLLFEGRSWHRTVWFTIFS